MNLFRNPALDRLIPSCRRVLLVNAPAVDLRLPWARWQQPIGLLQIGAALKAGGCDVRLIDCLQTPPGGRLRRERPGWLESQGERTNLWRFGLSSSQLMARIKGWKSGDWRPDQILVSCQLSTWWQGARDVIAKLKDDLDASVILGGAYPTYYPEHAQAHIVADVVVVGDVVDACSAVPDLSTYLPGPLPRFAGIHLLHPTGLAASPGTERAPAEIADEVADKAALGVTAFAFFDNWLGPDHREPFVGALRAIVARRLTKIGFVALGNLSPRLIDDEVAALLRQARFRQVTLHDDLDHDSSGVRCLSSEDDYSRAIGALHQAGYPPRTEQVAAAVVAGIPGEDPARLAERLVRIASIVGSVNLVPYQYTPGLPASKLYERWLPRSDSELDPMTLNAQLYPLARLAGASLEDYRELTRLAALLNSKYHSRTFDFLGESLAGRLVRTSLREERWNPFPPRSTPPLPLPLLTVNGGHAHDRQR